MIVGVDFDNTIVCYDGLFHKVALERMLIPQDLPISKGQVRDFLRQHHQEDQWTELQGYVYGPGMFDAVPFPGALDFFSFCKQHAVPVRIISHRTRQPFKGPKYDLHQAARTWIMHCGFYERTGLSSKNVHFEFTQNLKLDRIVREGCNIFIDDLPEFLAAPSFPGNVRRILFDPNNRYPAENRFERITSWEKLYNRLNINS